MGLAADPSTDFLNGLVSRWRTKRQGAHHRLWETAARLRALLLQARAPQTAEDLELMRTLIAVDNVLTLFRFRGWRMRRRRKWWPGRWPAGCEARRPRR